MICFLINYLQWKVLLLGTFKSLCKIENFDLSAKKISFLINMIYIIIRFTQKSFLNHGIKAKTFQFGKT